MLEGQAAFRRSWWRRKKECQDEKQLLSRRQGSPTRGPHHSPFVWSTTVAGFPAPIITTRSIQIGVSKWPLGSAELEEAKMDTQQENNDQSREEESTASCAHPGAQTPPPAKAAEEERAPPYLETRVLPENENRRSRNSWRV